MKSVLIGLSLFAAACAGSPSTGPSSTSGTTTQASVPSATPDDSAAESTTVDPVPGGPGATSPTPVFSIAGPRDCVTAGTGMMRWVLELTDAGARALRFVALSQQDDSPGCAPTTKNARARVGIEGVTDYPPHSSGQTIFTFDPKMYACGRVQVDVSIFDAAGIERLVVGMVVDYGTVCTAQPPIPPLPIFCTTTTQNAQVGQMISFTASGDEVGPGYMWQAGAGSPATGTGTTFVTSFATSGIQTVVVTAATGMSASCRVVIVPSGVQPLVCSPATQTVTIPSPDTPHVPGPVVVVEATGGSGTYAWFYPGSTIPIFSGSSYRTIIPIAGTHLITVTSGTQTATCQVIVLPTPAPADRTP